MRFTDTSFKITKISEIASYRNKTSKCDRCKYVSTENLKQNFAGFTPYENDNEIKGTEFRKGDVLLGNIRPYLKKTLLAKFDGCCSSDVLVFQPKEIDSVFLYYLISNDLFINHVMEACKGSKMPRGDKNWMMSKMIAIPSVEEQEKIGCFLTLVDRRIKTQNKIIEHYESLIKTIIDSKIYTFNNKRETLKNYASLRNGYAFKSESYNENGQYKIVTIGNVTGNQYISDKTNNIDKIPFDIQKHQILKNNDILVSLTGNVGRVSMVNSDNCLLNQRVGLIQIDNVEFRNYIYVVLSSRIFEREMINKSQGAAQLNIGKSDVENYKIPKPTKTNLKISELIDKYLTKLSIEKRILKLLQDEKKYLLSNLFI